MNVKVFSIALIIALIVSLSGCSRLTMDFPTYFTRVSDGAVIALGMHRDEIEEIICHVDELKLLGIHNYENVMAGVAIAIGYGVPIGKIRESVKAFKGVAHRIEFVCERGGVAYYNDSKATNSDAAIQGIKAMRRPTVLIGGGYDKDAVYGDWIRSFDDKVKCLVLLGATREKIAKEARDCGFENIVLVDTLKESVSKCAELADAGDAVLLSPACASWGMFKNFEERGDKFKQLVNCL